MRSTLRDNLFVSEFTYLTNAFSVDNLFTTIFKFPLGLLLPLETNLKWPLSQNYKMWSTRAGYPIHQTIWDKNQDAWL